MLVIMVDNVWKYIEIPAFFILQLATDPNISYLNLLDKEKFEIQMEMLQDVTADMQMDMRFV